MTDELSQLIAAEEAKRATHCDPQLRWQFAQDMIRWAQQQRSAPPMTPESRLAEQARKLAQLAPPSSP
jgi:hypothetical protein